MEQNDKNTQLFMYLVSSFEMAAMQGLGKINSPVSGKIEKNLEQAQFAIDVMDMIKDKTKGNLTEYETRFLDTVSAQLKLNYVDEAIKKPEETKEEIKEENKEEAKKE
jgi:hypothetical protein